MKSKIVIAPSNKKALDAVKKMKEKKRKLQEMMAQDIPLGQTKR